MDIETKPENMDSVTPTVAGVRVKIVVIFVVIALVVVVTALLFQKKESQKAITETETKTQEVVPDYKVTQAKTGELPSKFPKDFPVEQGAKIDNSYNVTATTGTNATIHFESKRSLDSIFKTYTDYLTKKNGWTVLNTLDTPSVKSISALNKQNTSVMVNMAQNNLTKISQVTISFIYENK